VAENLDRNDGEIVPHPEDNNPADELKLD